MHAYQLDLYSDLILCTCEFCSRSSLLFCSGSSGNQQLLQQMPCDILCSTYVGLASSCLHKQHCSLNKWQVLQHMQCTTVCNLPLAMLAGLTGLTSLNLHGCDMITSQGLLVISTLTNLRHLDLDLCSKASGLQRIAGTVFRLVDHVALSRPFWGWISIIVITNVC